MFAYEFYWLDQIKGYQLIGVLPERRRHSTRITQKSILKWGQGYFGKTMDISNIFFIQVTINEETGKIHRPTPFFARPNKYE